MFITNCKISEISKHKYLRSDTKYQRIISTYNHKEFVLLKDLFYIINGSVQTKYYSTEKTKTPYIRIGDISYKYGISDENIIYLDDDCDITDNKKLQDNDLILATIGATVGKIGLADKFTKGTFSNNTVCLRPKNTDLNSYFYEKLLQSNYYINYIFGVVSQKAQPNLQQYDLENIKLPVIDKSDIIKYVAECKKIENKIIKIKNQIKPVQEIIDENIAHKFQLDTTFLYEINDQKIINSTINKLSFNNTNLRSSTRWNKAGLIQKKLISMSDIFEKLGKHIINTRNGFSPECAEGASLTAVLGLDCLNKDTVLNFDNPKFTNIVISRDKDCFVKDDDFLISRGNTTDLVALASIASLPDDSESYIFPDIMIRIDFKSSVNKQYMAYVFNSFIGRLYFKYATKGKNQTMVKTSAKELNDFYVPLPHLDEQKRIVDKIKKEIDKQNLIKSQIADLREQIDTIIENAITNAI